MPGNLTLVDHSLTRAFEAPSACWPSVVRRGDYSKGVKTPLPAVAGAPVQVAAPALPAASAPEAKTRVFERVCGLSLV